MEHDRIIAKTDKPTDWVNSLVIVEKKDGSLLLCLDPKDLNSVIGREHFQIPTLTSVEGRNISQSWTKRTLTGKCICTLSTPFGRYRFLRFPFRIRSASEVLEKRGFKMYGDMQHMQGVEVIADDMIITGASGGAWSPVEKCDAKGKRTKCEVQSQKDPV